MDKDTTVLLPDYGVSDLRDALTALGFHRFIAHDERRAVRARRTDADDRGHDGAERRPAR